MNALYLLIDNIITLYIWLLIITAVISWLIAFNLLNINSRAVQTVRFALYRLTEPALAPIRRFLPNLGAIDISPIILILILFFIRDLLSDIVHG